LRLLLSLLALFIWSVSPEIDVQGLQGPIQGQGTLAATKSVAHRAILARNAARHAGAETSRYKAGGYVHARKGDGKLFGIVAELLLPLQPASDAPLGVWSEARPGLPPIHAFDARGPPILPA
jgi:hypothetical protein